MPRRNSNITVTAARQLGIMPNVPPRRSPVSEWEEAFLRLWNQFGNSMQPVREYRFIPKRKFRADFAWPEKKVAVEIDGCQWVKGGHNSGYGKQRDYEKDRLAIANGWRVLRFVSDDIVRRPLQCCEEVIRELEKH